MLNCPFIFLFMIQMPLASSFLFSVQWGQTCVVHSAVCAVHHVSYAFFFRCLIYSRKNKRGITASWTSQHSTEVLSFHLCIELIKHAQRLSQLIPFRCWRHNQIVSPLSLCDLVRHHNCIYKEGKKEENPELPWNVKLYNTCVFMLYQLLSKNKDFFVSVAIKMGRRGMRKQVISLLGRHARSQGPLSGSRQLQEPRRLRHILDSWWRAQSSFSK